jgi:uncharacterized membrane protein
MNTKYKLILITFLISITESFEKYFKKKSLKKVDISIYLFIELLLSLFILLIYILYNNTTNDLFEIFYNINNDTYKIILSAIAILLFNKIVKYYLLSNNNLLDVLIYDDSLDIIAITLISYFLLNETISKERLLGIIIIMIGIYIFNKY